MISISFIHIFKCNHIYEFFIFSFQIYVIVIKHFFFYTERGKLVIAILHDMDFVAENFERVIIMAHGQVLADGTAKEVFAQEEALKKARLQKPYVMQLCEALGYEKSYLTVEELLKDQVS